MILQWSPDSRKLYFLRFHRSLRKLELLVADTETGSSRVIVTDEADVFKVAVAGSAITDQGRHWGNEGWVGPPELNPEGYEYSSNIRLAGNLKGKLLLIHGTHDVFVPLSNTLRMAQALIEADKPFDLLIMPGKPHASEVFEAGYGRDATVRYFLEHLGLPD